MWVISIISYLGWQVKGHTQTSLSSLKKVLESLVCLVSGTKAGILSHCPKSVTIHSWVDSSCEGGLSRLFAFTASLYLGIIESFYRNVRVCLYFIHEITLTSLISSLPLQMGRALLFVLFLDI